MDCPNARLPVPINEAEAILDAFWDEHLSPLGACTLDGSRGRPAGKLLPPTGAPCRTRTWTIFPS
jgi:hypothetical protein